MTTSSLISSEIKNLPSTLAFLALAVLFHREMMGYGIGPQGLFLGSMALIIGVGAVIAIGNLMLRLLVFGGILFAVLWVASFFG